MGTIQKLSGERYALHFSVSEAASGEQKAAFTATGILAQFEGSGSLINQASAELLAQLGVTLTERGRASLLGGNNATARAENALAKGAAAQASGDQVGALLNYAQAASFDPGQLEALSRLNTLSSTISGGSVSERIINDLQARDRWIAAFKEAARFYQEHPPFEFSFDPSLEQSGETDYVKRTANLKMYVSLSSAEAGFKALNALLEGLEKTGRRDKWGFASWPFGDLRPAVPGVQVFNNGWNRAMFAVEIRLLNERKKEVGKGSIILYAAPRFAAGNKSVVLPEKGYGVINFQDIKADDLTPALTIIVSSVNGISSRDLSGKGYMRIAPEEGLAARQIAAEKAAAEKAAADKLAAAEKAAAEKLAAAEKAKAEKVKPQMERAAKYEYSRDYDRAIAEYNEAIKIEPTYAEAYARRASAYFFNKEWNYDRSMADYAQAIKLNPYNASYYLWHANIHRGMGYYDNRVIADYTQVIKLRPTDYHIYELRGECYVYKGDYDKAIEDYTEALRLTPNTTSYKKTIKDLEKTIKRLEKIRDLKKREKEYEKQNKN